MAPRVHPTGRPSGAQATRGPGHPGPKPRRRPERSWGTRWAPRGAGGGAGPEGLGRGRGRRRPPPTQTRTPPPPTPTRLGVQVRAGGRRDSPLTNPPGTTPRRAPRPWQQLRPGMVGGWGGGGGAASYFRLEKKKGKEERKKNKEKKEKEKKNSSGRHYNWACSVQPVLPRAGSARRVFRAAGGAGLVWVWVTAARRGGNQPGTGRGRQIGGRFVTRVHEIFAFPPKAGCFLFWVTFLSCTPWELVGEVCVEQSNVRDSCANG